MSGLSGGISIRGGTSIQELRQISPGTERVTCFKITDQDRVEVDAVIVREVSLNIVVNGRQLVTLLCSPNDVEFLAAGFIRSQRLIKSKDDIESISVDSVDTVKIQTKNKVTLSARSVLNSSGAKSFSLIGSQGMKTNSQIRISSARIFSLMESFEQHSKDFKITGGTHSAALCDTNDILVFNEDIGRHNAIDKVFGQCLLHQIDIRDSIVLTSGRISSEILLKITAGDIPPVVISKNAPTDLGIKMAKELGITLAGFVRGKSMTVYSSDWRIVI